jgi:hypothetical protein
VVPNREPSHYYENRPVLSTVTASGYGSRARPVARRLSASTIRTVLCRGLTCLGSSHRSESATDARRSIQTGCFSNPAHSSEEVLKVHPTGRRNGYSRSEPENIRVRARVGCAASRKFRNRIGIRNRSAAVHAARDNVWADRTRMKRACAARALLGAAARDVQHTGLTTSGAQAGYLPDHVLLPRLSSMAFAPRRTLQRRMMRKRSP